tara:strand:+ start:173 stop:514 length:342 start_codon:yes stop_codon:yes gene_type:complete
MSDVQYTEIVGGKRQWKQTIYLAEKFARYHKDHIDRDNFFLGVFKEELGLKEGDWTSYIAVYGQSYSNGLLVGDRISIYPFAAYKWVVKNGTFEEVVEDMESIFEIIRRAWSH